MPARKVSLRREFIARHVDVARTRVLEAGAMDEPTFEPDEGDDGRGEGLPSQPVTYIDWYTRDQAAERRQGREPGAFVEVSHVVDDKRFSGAVGGGFELVVANDLIERVPDLITWLQEVDKVTTDNGMLFLSVPDRRYTFDFLRRETDITDLLRAYQLDLHRPDFLQVLSALYYYRPVVARDFWKDEVGEKLKRKRFSIREAMRRADETAAAWSDVHCHVFSRESFVDLFDDLFQAGLVRWVISDIDSVRPGMNEFHALLSKSVG